MDALGGAYRAVFQLFPKAVGGVKAYLKGGLILADKYALGKVAGLLLLGAVKLPMGVGALPGDVGAVVAQPADGHIVVAVFIDEHLALVHRAGEVYHDAAVALLLRGQTCGGHKTCQQNEGQQCANKPLHSAHAPSIEAYSSSR